MALGGTLPIVQETPQQLVWTSWNATWRDLDVVDRNGNLVSTINLTDFDPAPSVNGGQNYAQVKAMFVAANAIPSNLSQQDVSFVGGLYHDVLGRAPGGQESAYFAGILRGAREQVLPQVAPILVNSPEYRQNLVAGYYQKFLGRPASAADLAYWGPVLQTAGAEQVIAAIATSPEYLGKHGSGLGWLQAIYPDVLGRPLDDAGQAFWMGQMNAGVAPGAVAMSLLTSAEYRSSLVAGYYSQLLKRSPGPDDLGYWTGQMTHGLRDDQILAAIAGTREAFVQNGDTIGGWVGGLYRAILGRGADAGGLSYFTDAVLSGYATTRQQVAQILLNSPEFVRRQTADDFSRLLGRAATEADQSTWLTLRQQLTDEQEVQLIVASPEYYQHAGGTNDRWLNQAYLDLLGRPRDPASDVFLAALKNGTASLQQVAGVLVGSGEYRAQLVQRFYSQFLKRSPGPGESAYWASLLAGSTDEDVMSRVLATSEYAELQPTG